MHDLMGEHLLHLVLYHGRWKSPCPGAKQRRMLRAFAIAGQILTAAVLGIGLLVAFGDCQHLLQFLRSENRPASYSFTMKSKPTEQSGSILTAVLQKDASGWRVSAWSRSDGFQTEEKPDT